MMSQDTAKPSSLLDLPNELILIISGELDKDDLLHLASTSQRINMLLIPFVFRLFGIQLKPGISGTLPSLSFTGETLKILPVLALAHFVESLDSIDCAFPAYNKYVMPKDIFSAADALNTLAGRLSHLGQVRINPYVTGHTTKELFGWAHAVATFLGSVARRGDCAITIYSGFKHHFVTDPRPFSHTFRAPPAYGSPYGASKSGTTCFQILQRALKALFRCFRCSTRAADPELGVAVVPLTRLSSRIAIPGVDSIERPRSAHLLPVTNSALTTLNAHSSFLFHATFYRWTLHLLNSSPLTSLSLDNIDLSHYDWAITLPQLTLPSLARLAVGQCLISVPDLAAFLARHPTISTLDLSFHAPIGALRPSSATQLLPHLQTLRATPDYILYFLAGGGGAGADEAARARYPELQLVGVTSNDESAYQVGQFARLVACVGARRVVARVEIAGKLALLRLPR
ncbi:hypothetical protein DFH06DRAFT_1471442 [Mycena polygramma]|nr:hypothetical protein DFH06DRAFT_1471442 [Mycena polygramma]